MHYVITVKSRTPFTELAIEGLLTFKGASQRFVTHGKYTHSVMEFVYETELPEFDYNEYELAKDKSDYTLTLLSCKFPDAMTVRTLVTNAET